MKDNNLEEIWKDIEGYEDLYQVSNLGRARSLDKLVNHWRGGVRTIKGRILTPKTNAGYQRVQLWKDGNVKMFYIHRLVYAAFNGAIPDGMEVNHINECKTDNRLCNLNLMSPSENINFGTRNERCAKAQSKPVIGYDEDGNVVVTFPSTAEAGKNGYSQPHISACCRGTRPKHKGLRWRYENGTA